jgi:hypothetical protein
MVFTLGATEPVDARNWLCAPTAGRSYFKLLGLIGTVAKGDWVIVGAGAGKVS